MNITEVKKVLGGVKCASHPGRVEDGTRVHVRYARIPGAKITATAEAEAKRAEELGLPADTYTGRVSRVWTAKDGSTILTMWVELERDHTYRSFNVDKGTVKNIVVLGN